MKFREITFPHPMKIMQVFCNTYAYTKEERSYEERREKMDWDVRSKSGHIADGKLYLPEKFFDDLDLEACQLISMEDYNFNKRSALLGGEPFSSNGFFYLGDPEATNIFQIIQGEALELHLDSDEFPKRKNFKVCELRQGEPVEIKINFKQAYPLWGTERYLSERSYVYEYAGDFDKCYMMREPFDHVRKQLPAERKVVDLLKPLWM